MAKRMVQVDEKLPLIESIPLSFQHLFAMFGATVLVPILFQVDPSTVLLMNGIGTLIYFVLTKFQVPAFLGSSFAFLAPAGAVIGSQGYGFALGGFMAAGLAFIIVGLIIQYAGDKWIHVVFPPAAMGAIVAIIGLELSPVAAKMAGLVLDSNNPGLYMDPKVVLVSLSTLAIIVIGSVVFRGFLSIIPILIGVVCGYFIALFAGLVDFAPVMAAPWLRMPTFYAPQFDIGAILTILPAALVVIAENIGHLVVTGNIVGKDLMKTPGLHRSLLGNGISTFLSALCGSVPTTSYGENIGVLAITKVYSVWVISGTAVISITLAFVGKFSALISTIPVPVMGGVSMMLFGVIAASGLRMLVDERVDYSHPRNLVLTATVLVVGLSGVHVAITPTVTLAGMALATIVSIFIALLFKMFEMTGILGDVEEPADLAK